MGYWLGIAFSCLDVLCVAVFCDAFLERKTRGLRFVVGVLLYGVLSYIATVFVSHISEESPITLLKFAALITVYFVFASLLYTGKFWLRLLVVVLAYAISTLLEFCVLYSLLAWLHIRYDEYVANMKLYLASAAISQNTKWGIRKKMHDGTYITSLTPFGYKKIDRQLFPDEKEAATVKEIFNLFLNGFSTAEIANHLNTNHPKPDVIWRSASVRFILRNEKYIGDSLFQKNYTPDTLPLKSCCNTGQLPKYYVEGTHPGIISKDEFERVQSLLTQKNINSTNSRACILSKVVFCALCGHVCSRKVRKSQTFVWCCRTHLQSAALCPLKPVSETEIQQAFLSVYNKLQANQSYILQPIIDTLLQLRFLQEQANSARQTARDDVQRLAKQRHNLTRIHTLGYIDNAQFLERSIALDQQLREKKKFLSKRTTDNSFERVLFQTRSIQQQLGSSPPLETFDGTIFTKLVNRVQVSPTTIEFKFMNGMTLSEKRSSL